MVWISQCFALLALCLTVISLQIKNNKSLFLLQMLSNLFQSLAFVFLQAYAGVFVTLVGALRFFVFYINKKSSKDFNILLLLFIMYFFSAILGGDGVWSWILSASAFLYTYTCFLQRENLIRVGSILISLTIIVYNLKVNNYICVFMEMASICSAMVFLLRNYNTKLKV